MIVNRWQLTPAFCGAGDDRLCPLKPLRKRMTGKALSFAP